MALSPATSRGGSGGGSLAVLFDTTLVAPAASIDIGSVSAAYAHLKLVANLRGDAAVAAVVVQCRFNNDSGANYDYQYSGATAGAGVVSLLNGGTSLALGDCPAASATANYAATIEAIIANYGGLTFDKACHSRSAFATSTGGSTVQIVEGHWRTVATAINRITLLPSSGNFVTGSRLTLYGLSVT